MAIDFQFKSPFVQALVKPMLMRWFLILVGVFPLLAGCHRKSPGASERPHGPLPTVAIEAVPAPNNPTFTLERGSNLGAIASEAYGHGRFSGFVATLNGITDQARIPTGTILKTPSLAVAFRDAGLDPAYQPAINALAKAWTDYLAVEPAYKAARRASAATTGSFAIPADMKAKFMACADAIEAGAAALSIPRPPHSEPKLTIAQFRKAADQVLELAHGSNDPNGYDYDMVGQRFGLAFTNALIWAQKEKH